ETNTITLEAPAQGSDHRYNGHDGSRQKLIHSACHPEQGYSYQSLVGSRYLLYPPQSTFCLLLANVIISSRISKPQSETFTHCFSIHPSFRLATAGLSYVPRFRPQRTPLLKRPYSLTVEQEHET